MASFATSAISVGIFVSALAFTLHEAIWCALENHTRFTFAQPPLLLPLREHTSVAYMFPLHCSRT